MNKQMSQAHGVHLVPLTTSMPTSLFCVCESLLAFMSLLFLSQESLPHFSSLTLLGIYSA